MDDVIFELKTTVAFGLIGKYGGYAVTVYRDGSITKKMFLHGKDEPVSDEKLACIPEMAALIEKVIEKHKDELNRIPDKLNNRTLDGSHDCFRFGEKAISSWTIQRSDLLEVQRFNPSYYAKYEDNMIYENMVLDIYDEIAEIINRFGLGAELKIK